MKEILNKILYKISNFPHISDFVKFNRIGKYCQIFIETKFEYFYLNKISRTRRWRNILINFS